MIWFSANDRGGFDQMPIESRLGGPLPDFVLSIAGDCHQVHPGRFRHSPQRFGDVVAGQFPIQPNVAQDQVGANRDGQVDSLRPVASDVNFVPRQFQNTAQCISGITAVVDDHDPATARVGGRRSARTPAELGPRSAAKSTRSCRGPVPRFGP